MPNKFSTGSQVLSDFLSYPSHFTSKRSSPVFLYQHDLWWYLSLGTYDLIDEMVANLLNDISTKQLLAQASLVGARSAGKQRMADLLPGSCEQIQAPYK